jgi:ABC-type sugar transport system substrate-binding protein
MKHFWLMLFVAVLAARLAPAAQAAEPIKIGFSMELTGPFAVVGKTGLSVPREGQRRAPDHFT